MSYATMSDIRSCNAQEGRAKSGRSYEIALTDRCPAKFHEGGNDACSANSGLLFRQLFALLLLHRLSLDTVIVHLTAIELRQMFLKLIIALGISELEPFLGAQKQNFFLPGVQGGARQFDAFGGSLPAGLPVDF
jgi:hypothetical protein